MRSFIFAAALLASTAFAETPGNFSPAVSATLDVEYGPVIVTPGKVIGGRGSHSPFHPQDPY